MTRAAFSCLSLRFNVYLEIPRSQHRSAERDRIRWPYFLMPGNNTAE